MKKLTIGILTVFVLVLAACNSKPKAEKAKEAEKLEAATGLHEADKHGEGEGEHSHEGEGEHGHSHEDGGHEHN